MAQYQSFPDAAGDSRTLEKLKALKLPDLSGRRFLDVGCNEGFFCGFAKFQGAVRSIGIDHSRAFIERAQGRFPACEFHQQGWEQLPDGSFDVILLASALHYADDQAALLHQLVERLAPDGLLVLELGIASSEKSEWIRIKRGIDERYFPSMPKLREVLADYAWKWMGRSVSQDGDPVGRHVIHISRRRPVAYLLMQPPGFGKSSLASRLFVPAGMPVVSGDQQLSLVAEGKLDAPEQLRSTIADDYSPFRIDQTIQRIFENDLGGDLVRLWAAQAGDRDFALDAYVPPERHTLVEEAFIALGYLPVQLHWQRVGPRLLPAETMGQHADAYYLSLVDSAPRPDTGTDFHRNGLGFVDELTLRDGQLLVRGWAVDASGELPARIGVRIKGKSVVLDAFDKQSRPDVQRHLGLPHALVGYQVAVDAKKVADITDLATGFEVYIPSGASFQLAGPLASLMTKGE